MFIHGENDPAGPVLIPQVSHAWLAWQVAEHWGNRRFARPAPRPEVLAAVLLHDSGWTETDAEPSVDRAGQPHIFSRMPVSEHLAIWRSCVSRVSLHCRYAALLVAAHFSALAEVKTKDLLEKGDTASARAVQVCRAELLRRQEAWRESLRSDARYANSLSGPGWDCNLRLFSLCDRISVFLCASMPAPFEVEAPTTGSDTTGLGFTAEDHHAWRVRPWPFAGDKVRLQCEGRKLSRLVFESTDEYREMLLGAPTVRLKFTLLRSSARYEG
jgi:hypothetical protein